MTGGAGGALAAPAGAGPTAARNAPGEATARAVEVATGAGAGAEGFAAADAPGLLSEIFPAGADVVGVAAEGPPTSSAPHAHLFSMSELETPHDGQVLWKVMNVLLSAEPLGVR
jgi:hypothetical protein